MQRRHLNLALAAAALGLGAALYFGREQPEPPKPLTTLGAAAVNRILLQHPGAADIELAREDGEWWLVKPVRVRAEGIEVGGILDVAAQDIHSSYPAAEMPLAEVGLAEPDRRLQLNEVEIAFGGLEPLESRRYVQIGDQVHLIEDPPSAALDADYADLVSKRLLREGAKITSIDTGAFTLTRGDKGGWQVAPRAADRGADAAQQLAGAWAGAQAMWITLSQERNPRGRAVSIEAGGERLRFIVLDNTEQLQLARPELGVIYTLPKNLAESLFELRPPAPAGEDGNKAGTQDRPAAATPPAQP